MNPSSNRNSVGCLFAVLSLFATAENSDLVAQETRANRLKLDKPTKQKCLRVLREGLHGDEFWPSIHAAEGLTLGGRGEEVIAFLEPKLATEKDDQRRCGIARELVRAGKDKFADVMLKILSGDDDYGHVHAAESLYKVIDTGGGAAMKQAFATKSNLRLQLMAAGALAKSGDGDALEFLRANLSHDDSEMYKIAAWILGRIGDKSDIERLTSQLDRSQDELTRAYIQHSARRTGRSGRIASARKESRKQRPVRSYLRRNLRRRRAGRLHVRSADQAARRPASRRPLPRGAVAVGVVSPAEKAD